MRLEEALELLPAEGGPELLVMELATGGERTIDGIADGRRVVLGHPKTREAMRAGLAMYFVTLDDAELEIVEGLRHGMEPVALEDDEPGVDAAAAQSLHARPWDPRRVDGAMNDAERPVAYASHSS